MVDQDEHKEITVETLSTPPIKIAPAPILRRIAAMIIDSLILVILWQSLSIASGQGIEQVTQLPNYVPLSTLALIAFAYYFLLEGLLSASLGKSLFKLTALEETGDACSLEASFKRNLLRFIDWLPFLYGVGGVSVMISANRQRIGDKFARTIVTKAPEKDLTPPPAPFLFH
jgi:uncharacterized RDD family membrane protein YckC